eukprot:Phypoly_transcript_03589.p1 GENE.Phypoly_transcript_03589~~Phypoly_transcript_03589.p1  ORF type:complete len:350 (-),score=56.09 Phypoly_transcript_03589:111-1160(-)
MGNSTADGEIEVATPPMERMTLKFPRPLFEQAIAQWEEKKISPKKRKKRKGKDFSRVKRHKTPSPPSSSPVPPSSSPVPPSSSPFTPSSSSSSSLSPSPSPPPSPPAPAPRPVSLPLPLPPRPPPPPPPRLPLPPPPPTFPIDTTSEANRPVRESKKKFYELLESVVSGDPCPIRYEPLITEQPFVDKKCKLTKAQKKTYTKLMSCRRHFPAEIMTIEGKGTGVKTLRALVRHQFICEYHGELITKTEALRREKVYAARSATRTMPCYMYYFEHRGQEMCIDATAENGTFGIGRLINHSVNGNLDTVKLVIDGVPRLAFIANRDISAGDELAYDYGDRTSFAAYPWLKK